MKNKKIIFGLLGVLAAALLITPKLLGGRIEEQIRALPNQKVMQDVMDIYGVGFEVTNYERGWFSSEATFQVTFSQKYEPFFEAAREEKAEIPALVYTIPVKHGPILFGERGISIGSALMEGEIALFGENAAAFHEILGTLPRPIVSTRFGFTGNQSGLFLLKKGEWVYTGENGATGTVSWENIESLTETDFRDGKVFSSFSMPVIRFEALDKDGKDAGFFEITNVSSEISYNLNDPFPLFTPDGFIQMEKVEMDFSPPDKERINFSASGFREEFEILRHENPNIIGWRIPISMGQISFLQDGETKTPLDSFSMVLEIDNLDQRDIRNYYESYFSMLTDLENLGDENNEEMSKGLLRSYLLLLKNGIRFDIPEARAVTMAGDIEYDHTLQLPPVPDPDNFDQTLWALATIYNGNINFSAAFVDFMVDKTLQSQLGANYENIDAESLETLKANTIMQMTLAGYLVANEDGSYSTHLSFENGVLLVNGNEMDTSPFLGNL